MPLFDTTYIVYRLGLKSYVIMGDTLSDIFPGVCSGGPSRWLAGSIRLWRLQPVQLVPCPTRHSLQPVQHPEVTLQPRTGKRFKLINLLCCTIVVEQKETSVEA